MLPRGARPLRGRPRALPLPTRTARPVVHRATPKPLYAFTNQPPPVRAPAATGDAAATRCARVGAAACRRRQCGWSAALRQLPSALPHGQSTPPAGRPSGAGQSPTVCRRAPSGAPRVCRACAPPQEPFGKGSHPRALPEPGNRPQFLLQARIAHSVPRSHPTRARSPRTSRPRARRARNRRRRTSPAASRRWWARWRSRAAPIPSTRNTCCRTPRSGRPARRRSCATRWT